MSHIWSGVSSTPGHVTQSLSGGQQQRDSAEQTVWQLKLHGVNLWQGNSSPTCSPERTENICLHKILHMNVYSNIIHIAKW